MTSVLPAVGAEPQKNGPVASVDGGGPRIQFVAPVYDFGTVVCGEVVRHDFDFTNTGDQALVIDDVRTSCECTTARRSAREIPPGKSGMVSIKFLSLSFTGPVSKSVVVTCNDTNQPVVTLQVTGTVWRAVDIIPQSANFAGSLESLSNLSRTIRIIGREDEPLVLSPPETSHRAISAELQTNQPGKEYRLVVTLVPPLGAGNLFGRVTLKTSYAKLPILDVPVYALLQPGVMLLPPQIEIPAGPSAHKLSRTVSIQNNWTHALTLSDPRVNAQGVDVQLHELRPGQLFSIVLTFPEGFQPTPGGALELSFKSNHPQYPLAKVPILTRK